MHNKSLEMLNASYHQGDFALGRHQKTQIPFGMKQFLTYIG